MGREMLKGPTLSCQQIRQDNCSEEVAIRSIADMCNVFLWGEKSVMLEMPHNTLHDLELALNRHIKEIMFYWSQ